jgi:hypothetical protein
MIACVRAARLGRRNQTNRRTPLSQPATKVDARVDQMSKTRKSKKTVELIAKPLPYSATFCGKTTEEKLCFTFAAVFRAFGCDARMQRSATQNPTGSPGNRGFVFRGSPCRRAHYLMRPGSARHSRTRLNSLRASAITAAPSDICQTSRLFFVTNRSGFHVLGSRALHSDSSAHQPSFHLSSANR